VELVKLELLTSLSVSAVKYDLLSPSSCLRIMLLYLLTCLFVGTSIALFKHISGCVKTCGGNTKSIRFWWLEVQAMILKETLSFSPSPILSTKTGSSAF